MCPACGTNEKGVKSTYCRACSIQIKKLEAISRRAEENNILLTKAAQVATETAIKVDQMHEEAGNSETVFGPGMEPELIGVDLAKPGSDRSVVVTKKPGKEPEFEEVYSPEAKQRPARIGETTPDGKFYK